MTNFSHSASHKGVWTYIERVHSGYVHVHVFGKICLKKIMVLEFGKYGMLMLIIMWDVKFEYIYNSPIVKNVGGYTFLSYTLHP